MTDELLLQQLFWPTALFVFLWGLIWGSFFNVCIYRIPAGKSVVKPGSHCFACGSPVRWYDNIPLLSYLMLRGSCRECGTHFSPRYFFIELFTALLFLAVYLAYGPQLVTPLNLVFVSFLIIGTFTDIDHFIIPDRITWGGAIFGVVVSAAFGPHSFAGMEYPLFREWLALFTFDFSYSPTGKLPSHLVVAFWSLASAIFGYTLLWVVGFLGRILFRKEAMGMGDVKLFAFIGAYMGTLNSVLVLFVSAFIGAVAGLSLLLAHKLTGKDQYDVVAFPSSPTVKSRWLSDISQSPEEPAISSDAATDDASPEAADLSCRFSTRTARQLHHFPYGPYIALAACLILIFRDQLHQVMMDYMLSP